MKNIYGGNISYEELINYFNSLIGDLYKLMPLKENKYNGYEIYLHRLLCQICGGENLIISNNYIIKIIFNLEGLKRINDIKLHNSIVKENISLCKKIIENLKKGDVEL